MEDCDDGGLPDLESIGTYDRTDRGVSMTKSLETRRRTYEMFITIAEVKLQHTTLFL
jgi:hypothetical protein